ncbi:MAG: hypothetical protein LBR17_08470 [Bacteroidales bacterium]|jgi:Na+-transporting NADH:ubiquinone oxidoreductase subunit NqrC|nr:hypothetical protein [Bacteroidales bacterium]
MSIDSKKIAQEQFAQNEKLAEVHICSNGAVYRQLKDAQEFQKVFDPKKEVVSITRAVKPAKTEKTAEELTAEIATLEAGLADLNGIAKVNAQKKLAKLLAALADIEPKE